MFSRRRSAGRRTSAATTSSAASPREKYDEFARENGRIKEEVEEALSELDELARDSDQETATRDKPGSDG
jgi:hypothetical protein